MSTQLSVMDSQEIEHVLLTGDLSRLTPDQKLSYYNRVCESLDLNPLTKPFQYLKLNGKEILYASKDCSEQLRKKHTVSVRIVGREVVEGCYVVTAQAALPSGRVDESIGAVPIENLRGESRSNAMMKCETKAKRRVTLSICGLGMLDESEVDSIPGAMFPDQGSKEAQQDVAQRRIKELQLPPAHIPKVEDVRFDPNQPVTERPGWSARVDPGASVPAETIMELADSLDQAPEPPLMAPDVKKSAKKAVSNMTEAAKKRWLQAKLQLRAVRDDKDKFYYASIAPYRHCTEIPSKEEAENIWKVLQSGLAPNSGKQDAALMLELEAQAQRIGQNAFDYALQAHGLKSIKDVLALEGEPFSAFMDEVRGIVV